MPCRLLLNSIRQSRAWLLARGPTLSERARVRTAAVEPPLCLALPASEVMRGEVGLARRENGRRAGSH
jgi:hypothetical protein